MRPDEHTTTRGGDRRDPAGHPAVVAVRAFVAEVRGLDRGNDDQLDDAVRIELLRALEEAKAAAEGAQAALTAAFADSQRRRAEEHGEPAERRLRGVAAQVALARRESPHRGERHLQLATVLRRELPGIYQALRAGRISEHRASLVAQATACLRLEHRSMVDEELAGSREALDELETTGDRSLVGRVRARAAELDAASVAEARRRAERDRHTTLRPAPDTMTWFGALLPVKDGVALDVALRREADRLRAAGDQRGRGQIMADTLVERVLRTGAAAAEEPASGRATGVDLVVNVLVPDTVLLGDADRDDGAGWVEGHGPVPGDLLREWIADHLESDAERGRVTTWLRRLYQEPATGRLVAMDSSLRRFEGLLALFLRLRDQVCRTPWCDAPVRHSDHVVGHAEGGPTSAHNGQGTCEACDHAKQAPGWSARPRPGPRHTVETTTPTGHTYTSIAPDLTVARHGRYRLDLRWAA